jgi:hypothetical protein
MGIWEGLRESLRATNTEEDARREASYIVGCAIATGLITKGWELTTNMGKDVKLTMQGTTIQPFVLADELENKETGQKKLHNALDSCGVRDTQILPASV